MLSGPRGYRRWNHSLLRLGDYVESSNTVQQEANGSIAICETVSREQLPSSLINMKSSLHGFHVEVYPPMIAGDQSAFLIEYSGRYSSRPPVTRTNSAASTADSTRYGYAFQRLIHVDSI